MPHYETTSSVHNYNWHCVPYHETYTVVRSTSCSSTNFVFFSITDWRKREALKWPQRMGITMGVARGIQYLHTGGIVGNDIKIDTILLDESLTARISSYNITIPSKVKRHNDASWHCINSRIKLTQLLAFHRWAWKALCTDQTSRTQKAAAKIQKRKTYIGWELFLLRSSPVDL